MVIALRGENLEKYVNKNELRNTIDLRCILKDYQDVKKIKFEFSKCSSKAEYPHFKISSVEQPELELEFYDCKFEFISIKKNSKIKNITLNKINVGTIGIANSTIKNVKIRNCYSKSKSGIEVSNRLEMKKSEIDILDVDNTFHIIDISDNSKIERFELSGNKEKFTSLSLKDSIVDFLIVFELYCSLDFRGTIIKELLLAKIKLPNENDSLIRDEWFLTKDASIQEISVYESTFPIDLKVSFHKLKEIIFKDKNTFKSLTINHKNANIKIDDCSIEEKLFIGNNPEKKETENNESEFNKGEHKETEQAISSKFTITNNTIGKGISFGKLQK